MSDTFADAAMTLTEKDFFHLRLLEAILFSSPEAQAEKDLKNRLPDADVPALLLALQRQYQGRGITLRKTGGSWAFRTAEDLAPHMVVEQQETRKLSRAALETLAIIAYHQPVTRAEIEDIRGVAVSKGTLDILLEAGWIRPRGRRATPGRPLTWGTSDAFLDHFGLNSLRDLPGLEDLRAAGLLDQRPSIAAYGARARDEGPLVDMDGEEGPDPDQLDLPDI
ncbi:SMC-Scp complex subunit ScpB [Novispirillum itersonii]|uniref:SMC-Scp complex subunit ScpB n=1 Tax=Novispirillum itersonii TaxID=189 RepID=UPI00035F2CAD|nr:SMC-Scp complex subunit ScpB [Novispirillum itersonii]